MNTPTKWMASSHEPQLGKFIVIEGLEGAGKTTAMHTIKDYLEHKAIRVILTREPGGTHVGEVIRTLLKEERQGEVLDARTELFLLYAARVQHVEQVIKPALSKGEWVLCDRFELSTIAYQGGGRGLDLELIQQVSTLCLQGFSPDLTFFLDIKPQDGLHRASLRGQFDRIEKESLHFFANVYHMYHQAIDQMSKIKVIDANQPVSKVQEDIIRYLDKLFCGHDVVS